MRAVVFDLDGTLVDSLADIAEAMNHALRERGLPTHPPSAIRAMVGDGVRKLAERAAPELAEPQLTALVDAYRAYYAVHLLDHTRPFDGIERLVTGLGARGAPLGVLSNKPDDATVRIVDALWPQGTFRSVRGERAGVARKPDPASALALARELGALPAEVIFVGDTPVDIETGRRAGMWTAAVGWGLRDEDELARAHPDVLVRTPAELGAVLEQKLR